MWTPRHEPARRPSPTRSSSHRTSKAHRGRPGRRSWRLCSVCRYHPTQLDLFRRHTERQTPPAKPFNEAALVIGRRGGKVSHPRPGRGLSGVLPRLCPSPRCGRARDDRDHCRRSPTSEYNVPFYSGMLDAVPMLRAMVEDRTAEAISLSNRVVIEIHTAHFGPREVIATPRCSPTKWRSGGMKTAPTPTVKSPRITSWPGFASPARCC